MVKHGRLSGSPKRSRKYFIHIHQGIVHTPQLNVGLQPVQQSEQALPFRLQGLFGLFAFRDVTTEGDDLEAFPVDITVALISTGVIRLHVDIIKLQTSDMTLLQARNHFNAIALTVICGRPVKHVFADNLR